MLRSLLYISISFLTLLMPVNAPGQITYQTPPDILTQLVDAPPIPGFSISPDETHFILLDRPSVPSLEDLAAPELRLAGLRFNPENFGPSRSSHYTGISVRNFADDLERPLEGIPAGARIRNVQWSPDSKHIAFTIDFVDKIGLYVANIASGQVWQLTDRAVNNVYPGQVISWMPDSQHILARLIPEDHGTPPEASRIPDGPIVQENLGGKSPARTYQDLLQNVHDESVFEYFVTSQPVLMNLDGEMKPLSEPGLITRTSPSPSGDLILMQVMHRPFSYLVPYYRFPVKKFVIDTTGKPIKEIADLPLAEGIPTAFGSVREGIRTVNWRNDQPATLYWVEAQDEGDARKEAAIRDELFMLAAPFEDDPVSIAQLPLRYSSIAWGNNDLALITESWWSTRQRNIYRIHPGNQEKDPELLFELSTEDRYNNPGSPVYTRHANGRSVLLTSKDGNSIFMIGTGASPEGNRPFVRTLNVDTRSQETLFRSEAPYYEYPVQIFASKPEWILTRRESINEPPNYYLRNLNNDKITPVTDFPHPYPELSGISKEMLTYEREDGVQLSAILYTPSGYEAERDGPLPTLLWAYPREFKSAANAGQLTDSPYRFKTISYWGALPYVTQGYAILDRTAMPVIGEGEDEPNDTFIEQLVMNAEAAIKAGAHTGAIDPDRVAIGGHSYGAFMTANLLAHSDLFKTGIARSGAYNRSLTPFGFQAEQRTFWEAPEIYFAMSPFMHAEKVNEPILLIHGEADNNSGTFPIQSIRYYNALKGHGKTARLVMLPYESHGYRARKSLLHMLWETHSWMEKHLKPEKGPGEIANPTG